MKRVMVVMGTRPEAIKLCPLVRELRKRGKTEVSVLSTGQHRAMLDSAMEAFSVRADFDLDAMRTGQSSATLASRVLKHADEIFEAEKPIFINSVIEYVDENFSKRLSLDGVAEHFFVSRGKIIKEFREKLDTTFHCFLTQRRLIEAKKLIGEGEALETVAQMCGFSDYSSFFRTFKKEYGISPREFGKLALGKRE